MYAFYVVILLIHHWIHFCRGVLSCADFKLLNLNITYTDLVTMPEEDVVACMPIFGSSPLGDQEGAFIWNKLLEARGGVGEVTDEDLRQLGWVLHSVPETDMANFTLNEPDTIAAIGHFWNLTESQTLAERVLEDWANKDPQQYTNYDLQAMQHILCGFNQSSILLIHSDSYKDAAGSLSTLKGCMLEPLQGLATLAQALDAFGQVQSWTGSQLKNVGCVINGLSAETLALIPPIGFEAITPDIIPCINPEILKVLNSAQLSYLSPSAINSLTSQQRASFTFEQQKTLKTVLESVQAKSSASIGPKIMTVSLLSISNLIYY